MDDHHPSIERGYPATQAATSSGRDIHFPYNSKKGLEIVKLPVSTYGIPIGTVSDKIGAGEALGKSTVSRRWTLLRSGLRF